MDVMMYIQRWSSIFREWRTVETLDTEESAIRWVKENAKYGEKYQVMTYNPQYLPRVVYVHE